MGQLGLISCFSIYEKPRYRQRCEIAKQRWAFDIFLPGLADLLVHLHICWICQRWGWLKPLIAPLAVDSVPVAIVVYPTS